jgi:ribosomal-protein-alanine N-acetyltransferase
MASFYIRWLNRSDMQEVLGIEQASFPYPWELKDFYHILQPKKTWGKVCEIDGKVVGFIIYHTDRDAYNIVNLAVHPDYRKRGVGRALVDDMLEKVHPLRRHEARLTVSEQNLDAQLFFREIGFKATKVLRAFYGPDHDGYLMVYKASLAKFNNKRLDEICQGK